MTVHFANPMVYHDGMAIDYLKWTTLNKISKLKEIRKTPDEINQRFKSLKNFLRSCAYQPSNLTCREELRGFITRVCILAKYPFSKPKKDNVVELCLYLTI